MKTLVNKINTGWVFCEILHSSIFLRPLSNEEPNKKGFGKSENNLDGD